MNLPLALHDAGNPPGRTHRRWPAPVTAVSGSWLTSLQPAPTPEVPEPSADPELVDLVVRRIGAGAARWATQVGQAAAARVTATEPGRHDESTLQSCAESVTLTALLRLSADDLDIPALPEDGLRYVRTAARTGVTSEDLFTSIRLGHAAMSEAFLAACDALIHADHRAATLRSVSTALFDHVDRFARSAAKAHEDECLRLSASPAVTRSRVLQRLLDENTKSRQAYSDRDADEIERVLQYSLRQTHRALLVSPTKQSRMTGTKLLSIGYEIARATQARQHILHQAGDEVWIWLGGLPAEPEISNLPAPETVDISIGGRASGADGFRQTLCQAQDVHGFRTRAGRSPQIWHYGQIELALLLAQDHPRAKAFVANRLEGLLGHDRQSSELRETLKIYLDARSSPIEAARRMFLARNTVSARVRKAFDCLGRDPGADVLEIHAALVLVDVLATGMLPETAVPE